MTTARERAIIDPEKVAAGMLVALLATAIVNVAVVLAARSIFSIRPTLNALAGPALVAATVLPVLGNSLGYYMTVRRHHRHRLIMFVLPGTIGAAIGLAIALLGLPASARTGEILATALVNVLPSMIVIGMLALRTPPGYARVVSPATVRSAAIDSTPGRV